MRNVNSGCQGPSRRSTEGTLCVVRRLERVANVSRRYFGFLPSQLTISTSRLSHRPFAPIPYVSAANDVIQVSQTPCKAASRHRPPFVQYGESWFRRGKVFQATFHQYFTQALATSGLDCRRPRTVFIDDSEPDGVRLRVAEGLSSSGSVRRRIRRSPMPYTHDEHLYVFEWMTEGTSTVIRCYKSVADVVAMIS